MLLKIQINTRKITYNELAEHMTVVVAFAIVPIAMMVLVLLVVAFVANNPLLDHRMCQLFVDQMPTAPLIVQRNVHQVPAYTFYQVERMAKT
jgi:hypothetical protein